MTITNIPAPLVATPADSAAKPLENRDKPASTKSGVESMAADFEAIFVRQMLSTMRTSSLGEGLFDGQGMEEFRDMQDSMLANDMADKGVFGIADLLSRHVEKNNV